MNLEEFAKRGMAAQKAVDTVLNTNEILRKGCERFAVAHYHGIRPSDSYVVHLSKSLTADPGLRALVEFALRHERDPNVTAESVEARAALKEFTDGPT